MNSPFTPAEQKQIIDAIRRAEQATSGEIRVHIESHCSSPDPVQRAIEVFHHLGMHETKLRNGVLFYLAHTDHKFAIVGDQGINRQVPGDFWQSTKDLMRGYFVQAQYVEGLRQGINRAGQQLKHYFPYDGATDTNELPDDISFS